MKRIQELGGVALSLSMVLTLSLAEGCGGSVITLNDEDSGPTSRSDAGQQDARAVPESGPASDAVADAIGDAAKEVSVPDVAPPPTGLVTIPLGGCVPLYTAQVTLGGSKTFQLALDTGSTTLGVASSSCTQCEGVDPLYSPASPAVDEHETATSPYESGSWSGEIYQDTVSAGSPTAETSIKFVAIDKQTTFFQPFQCGSTPAAYEGIIGFAPSGSDVTGTDGYLDDLVSAGFTPNLFAFHLCDTGGTLWLGGYDATHTTAPPQYVPMSTSFFSQFYYLVNLASVTVDGTTVPVPTGSFSDSILDTGTSLFILQTDAFNAVTAAITADSGFQSAVSSDPTWFNNPDNCVSLSQTEAELNAALPPLTLTYGTGASAVSIQAVATDSYLYNYGGLWCPSLYSMAASEEFPFAADIGSPVLKSAVTIIDRAGQRVGFAPHAACP
jgi:Eukaryotic aspartyl protease